MERPKELASIDEVGWSWKRLAVPRTRTGRASTSQGEGGVDTPEEVLMRSWQEKGCLVCRGLWERGATPPQIAISIELHSKLHRCTQCGTLWEQHERYADVISIEEARTLYGAGIEKGPDCVSG